MANSSYDIRSGYFKVTDENRLKRLVETSGCSLLQHDGHFAFGAEGSDFCNIDMVCLDGGNDEDEEELDFSTEIQEILASGETCIIHENVHEKLCYVNSFVTIITENEIKVIDLRDIAIEEATRMNPSLSDANQNMNY